MLSIANRTLATRSLAEFVRQAWHVIEPSTTLEWNWHMDVICDHTQALIQGTAGTNNLAVNVPPGSSKSTIISVCLCPWVWTRFPAWRAIFASTSETVALRDSMRCRDILKSDWYTDTFKIQWAFSKDQDAKGLFRNDQTGFRQAVTAGSSITGSRGHFLACVSGDTIIDTKAGKMRMDDVCQARDSRNMVLGLNEATGEIEEHQVVDWQSNGISKCISIKSDTMPPLVCSENHPVYVIGLGWTMARDITLGMEVVANGMHMPPMRVEVSAEKLLRIQASDSVLRGIMRHPSQMGQVGESGEGEDPMPSVRKGNRAVKDEASALLQPWMLQQGAQRENDRIGKLELSRPGCGFALPGNEGSSVYSRYGDGAGWEFMRRLRRVGEADPHTPPERTEEGRQVGEHGLPLHCMPQFSPQDRRRFWNGQLGLFKATVSHVEAAGEIPVFNLKMQGESRNYFANGILTHNCDDPNDAAKVQSKSHREQVQIWWDTAMANRLINSITGKRCIIQQRLHEGDLTGHVTAKQPELWDKLIIRQEYEPSPEDKPTKMGWVDPRKTPGELLFPARFPQHILDEERGRMGSFGYAGQHQQRPAPEEGGLFKKAWFREFDEDATHYLVGTAKYRKTECFSFVTADLALSVKESADFSAIATWIVTPDKQLLWDRLWHGREEAPDIEKRLRAMWDAGGLKYLAVEKAHYGIAVIQTLHRAGIPVRPLIADKDKITRSVTAQVMAEAGRIWTRRNAPWAAKAITEACTFPNAAHDDVQDCLSHAAIDLVSRSATTSGPIAVAGEKRIF